MLLWLGKKPEVIYKKEMISKWSGILRIPYPGSTNNNWKNYEKKLKINVKKL